MRSCYDAILNRIVKYMYYSNSKTFLFVFRDEIRNVTVIHQLLKKCVFSLGNLHIFLYLVFH